MYRRRVEMVMLKDRKEDLEDRSHFIGGSDARVLMGGDEDALIRLWQQKRGEAEPPDLSGNLVVQLGLVTEGLNRFWFERMSGHRVGQCQSRKFHASIVWMAATLDGGPGKRGRLQRRNHSARNSEGITAQNARCGTLDNDGLSGRLPG